MERRLRTIFSASIARWLAEQNFPLPEPPFRCIPDGSLWTDDERSLDWLNDAYGVVQSVFQLFQWKLPGACGICSFRPVAAIGGDYQVAPQYTLAFPGWYAAFLGKYDEVGLLMYPGIFKGASPSEYDLTRMAIKISLYRKVTDLVAGELAATLRVWFADLGSRGIFGEAGIKSLSPTMRYNGRDAAFELDASGSGQETLNTLYLAILNWGMDQRQPLHMIDFAANQKDRVFESDRAISLR